MADNVLYMGVRGVTDLMVAPGLVNLDFADIRTVMAEMGKAMMGTGEADGENRSIRAAEAAISNPLLEDTSMAGARGLLINITGGEDMTLFEVDQAANRIREEVDEEANIIFGSAIDETLNGKIRVSVVATGIDTPMERTMERPRLVAMAGGSAQADVPATAELIEAPMSFGTTPPMGIRSAPPPGMLPQSRPQTARGATAGVPVPHMVPSAPLPGAPAAIQALETDYAAAAGLADEPVETSVASRMPPRPTVRTTAQPPRANGLSGDGQGIGAAPQPPRRSIFNIVTGAIRGSLPAAPVSVPVQPARAEPSLHDAPRETPVRANVRPTAGEEMGIDIPAFLRRQSS
jgi:cell division protein FtsZ